LKGVMLSESKHRTLAMLLQFKRLSKLTLMNFNVMTTPMTGLGCVKPLVNTGLDFSWEPDSVYNSLRDPMTQPVISRPLYDGPVFMLRQEPMVQIGATNTPPCHLKQNLE
jgi:hypothetical protein